MKKQIIIVVVAALVLVGIVAVILTNRNGGKDTSSQEVEIIEPIDVVLDFYDAWFEAVKSTSTDPFTLGLTASPELTEGMVTRLQGMSGQAVDGELDPVLCQLVVPQKIRAKLIFEKDNQARVLVMAGGEKLPGQAVVSLILDDSGWRINDISCSYGESAEVGEFSFERTGNLLKSVPPPLDPQYWHIVFEENGIMGHTAPLFFDAESVCTMVDGTQAVCDPSLFTEAVPVFIQGDMTEAGVQVKKIEMLLQ